MEIDFKQLIIYENNDFLVINKPAGLIVQLTKYQKENTLTDYLKDYYPKIKEVGEPGRPGLVHRLDKDVSGLMVIAKTKESYISLVSQFKNHQVKKIYIGLVAGHPPKEKGKINFPLARSRKGKVVAIKHKDGLLTGGLKMIKEAETKYEVINKFSAKGGSTAGGGKYSLLKIKPLTGRTNQIKIHLKAIGCPLVCLVNPLRIFLHAFALSFYDLKGDWREFEIELPKELRNFLSALDESSVGEKK